MANGGIFKSVQRKVRFAVTDDQLPPGEAVTGLKPSQRDMPTADSKR
jgi:hypothetical protein